MCLHFTLLTPPGSCIIPHSPLLSGRYPVILCNMHISTLLQCKSSCPKSIASNDFVPLIKIPASFQLVQTLPSPRGAPEAICAQPTHHLQLSSRKRNRNHSFIKCTRTPSAYLFDELSEYIAPPQRLRTGFQSSSKDEPLAPSPELVTS